MERTPKAKRKNKKPTRTASIVVTLARHTEAQRRFGIAAQLCKTKLQVYNKDKQVTNEAHCCFGFCRMSRCAQYRKQTTMPPKATTAGKVSEKTLIDNVCAVLGDSVSVSRAKVRRLLRLMEHDAEAVANALLDQQSESRGAVKPSAQKSTKRRRGETTDKGNAQGSRSQSQQQSSNKRSKSKSSAQEQEEGEEEEEEDDDDDDDDDADETDDDAVKASAGDGGPLTPQKQARRQETAVAGKCRKCHTESLVERQILDARNDNYLRHYVVCSRGCDGMFKWSLYDEAAANLPECDCGVGAIIKRVKVSV